MSGDAARGGFIAIEGLDGAGTTTQVDRLAARLRAHPRGVVRTNEPTDLPVGRLIRTVLRGEVGAPGRASLPWLFAADRADHLDRRVGPALAEGRFVVTDRYVPSSLAYQALEVPMDLVWTLNAGFPAPDLTVFVHVPVDVAMERIGRRDQVREVYERRELLDRVAANYEVALTRLAARGDRIARVDGTAPVEAVEAAIAELVASVVAG